MMITMMETACFEKKGLFPQRIAHIGCTLIWILFVLIVPTSSAYASDHIDSTGNTNSEQLSSDIAILWKKDLGEFIGAKPAVDSGRVYIGVWPDMVFKPGEEYSLYSLDPDTGDEIWRNPLGIGEGTVSTAAFSEGRIFVGCQDGRLYAVNAEDGTTLWSTKVEKGRNDDGNWHGLSTSPVVHDAVVYVNTHTNGSLHAFSVDGEPLWSYTTGNQTFVYSSPAYAQGTIFFAGHTIEHLLVAVNASSGSEIWAAPVDSQIRSTPVIDDEIVYVTTTDRLYAFHTADGDEIWSLPISGSWGGPAVTDGRIYLGTNIDHALHCIEIVSVIPCKFN